MVKNIGWALREDTVVKEINLSAYKYYLKPG